MKQRASGTDEAALLYRELELLRWRDHFLLRLEREPAQHLPDLQQRIEATVEAQAKIRQLLSIERLTQEHLRPAVDAWVTDHIAPIMDEANKDFLAIVGKTPGLSLPKLEDVTPDTFDMAKVLLPPMARLTIASGIASGAAAKSVTQTAYVFGLIVTTTISWPLLITALLSTGAAAYIAQKARKQIPTKVRKELAQSFLHVCQPSLIGGSFAQGKIMADASLKLRCQNAIHDATAVTLIALRSPQ